MSFCLRPSNHSNPVQTAVNKQQAPCTEVWCMNSYTLFSHVVDAVGAASCYRSHMELEGMGLLPSDDYFADDLQELTQDDADVRVAFALWTGIAPNPKRDTSTKHLFQAIATGRAKVPTAPDGDSFVLRLAEVLRTGPTAHNVVSVFISHVQVSGHIVKGRASIHYGNGVVDHFEVGKPFPAECWQGVTLDAKQLRAIHEDLTKPAGTWPAAPVQTLRPLNFYAGQISIA